MKIDYIALSEEIVKQLESAQSIVLATGADNKITARTMSHINNGLVIQFQTGKNSEKVWQMNANPNIAIAAGNLQIEATATIGGHPNENKSFIEKYQAKYPQYHALYTDSPDEILVTAVPHKISVYQYIDNKPCIEILNTDNKTAYREEL